MVDNPEASSTPKKVMGRKSIRNYQVVSPIENQKNISQTDHYNDKVQREDARECFSSGTESYSDGEGQVDSAEENSLNPEPNVSKTQFSVNGNMIYILFIIPVLVGLYMYNPQAEPIESIHSDFADLISDHPQTDDFWINVRVALHDIKRLKQPKSIIFLYEDDTTMAKVLNSISRYSSYDICKSKQVIQLPGRYLKNSNFLEDYGTFISEIRDDLAEKCVVIITNLDEAPGTSAQAFHSLCDEYNPVKEQVLFLFTMKVKSLANTSDKYIEKTLQEKWNDLHIDKFYPLYTRISTFVVKVKTEK